MATARPFRRKAFHCVPYEAQDVLVETDDVDLMALNPGPGFRFRDIWHRRLIHRDVTNRLVLSNPGVRPVRLAREYELFVAVCQTYEDLLYVNAIENWKDACKTSICWVDEIWAASVSKYKHWLRIFERFDHVFIACRGTIEVLSHAIGRQCHWLPMGVDTLRFTPYPFPAPRVIDVYSIGRRWEGVHKALLEEVTRNRLFYVYDTIRASDAEVLDYRQHRDLVASMVQRSRCFVVAPSKFDSPEETQGQVEIGYRYYEGSAAGAVMIGRAPQTTAFREMFGWPDAVLEIDTNGSDVVDLVMSLKAAPERTAALGRRNAIEALLRHDWVYRWKRILGAAGVPLSTAMADREAHLKSLAGAAASEETDPDHLVVNR
jgi:hypothetical protein